MSTSVAHSFNKLLNQSRSTKSRGTGELDEAIKRLRRMILVEGIPSAQVRICRSCIDLGKTTYENRTLLCDPGYGRSCLGWMTSLLTHICITFPEDHVKCARKLETIHSGRCVWSSYQWIVIHLCFRTLATDKGFKERVREDMLVRLLDAFVWRSHGSEPFFALC